MSSKTWLGQKRFLRLHKTTLSVTAISLLLLSFLSAVLLAHYWFTTGGELTITLTMLAICTTTAAAGIMLLSIWFLLEEEVDDLLLPISVCGPLLMPIFAAITAMAGYILHWDLVIELSGITFIAGAVALIIYMLKPIVCHYQE